MKSTTAFYEILQKNSFKTFGDNPAQGQIMAVGEVDGYLVTVSFISYSSFQISYAVEQADMIKPQLPMIRGSVKETLGKKCPIGTGKSCLVSTYVLKGKNPEEDFLNQINSVTRALKQAGIQPQQHCDLCHTGDSENAALLNGIFRPVHNGCLQQYVGEHLNVLETKHTNYFTGILGAIVGMLIGVLPSVLTIMMVDKIYAILFFLIPVAIFEGYRICKGKLGKVSLVTTIILSVVGVFVLQFIVVCAVVMTEYAVSLQEAFVATAYMFSDTEVLAAVLSDSIIDFIFVLLGIFSVWKRISTSEKSLKQDWQNLADTQVSLDELKTK